jgi:ATPase subunit of ABC transporter with duplicated ATPase domains
LKSAWFTEQVSGYPGLHTEKPYITKKKTKRGRRRKRRKKRMKRMKKRRRKKRRRKKRRRRRRKRRSLILEPGLLVQICNLRIWEAKARVLQVQGLLVLYNKTPKQKNKTFICYLGARI